RARKMVENSEGASPRRRCEAAAQTLPALPARAPSLRLLVQAARALAGALHVLAGRTLLGDAPAALFSAMASSSPAFPTGCPPFSMAGALSLPSAWHRFLTAWPHGALASHRGPIRPTLAPWPSHSAWFLASSPRRPLSSRCCRRLTRSKP